MKKVVVTSPATDAGKTFLASGLVEAAAGRGVRTLFLELDAAVGDAIRVLALASQAKSLHPTIASWSSFSDWPSACLRTRAGACFLPRPDGVAPVSSAGISELLEAAAAHFDLCVADLGADCYASYWPDLVGNADDAFLVADCDDKALARVNSFLCSYCPADPPGKWIMAVNARHKKSDYKPEDLTRYFEGAEQVGEVLIIPHFPALDRSPAGTFPPESDIADKVFSIVYGGSERGCGHLKKCGYGKNGGLRGSAGIFAGCARLFGRLKIGCTNLAVPHSAAPRHQGVNCALPPHVHQAGSDTLSSPTVSDSRPCETAAPEATEAKASLPDAGGKPGPAASNIIDTVALRLPYPGSKPGTLLLIGERSSKLSDDLAARGWNTTSDRSVAAEVAIVDFDRLSAAGDLDCPRVALGEGRISEWYLPVDDDVVVIARPSLVFDLLEEYRMRRAASKAAAVKPAGPFLSLPANGGGRVLSFYSGAQGYQGKTMLAINSGVLLTSRGRRACVVDMDSDKAGLTLLLGYSEMRPPEADLARDLERMSPDAVQGPAGVSVIPAPITSRAPGWFPEEEQIAWFISELRHRYDCVILDFGARLATQPMLEALRMSDRIILVSTPYRTALTAISRFRGREISEVGIGKTEAVINRVTRDSLTASDASRLLGFASYYEIPDDPVVVEAENDAVGNRIYHPPVLRRKNVIAPALSQILEGAIRRPASDLR
jgi:MinD-like ATPase involved in chromosome partitioning or flagellar assembly